MPVHCVTLPSTAALDCESIQGNIFNLEMRKCIFKGETSFLCLFNPMISILWMLEELGSQRTPTNQPSSMCRHRMNHNPSGHCHLKHIISDRFFWQSDYQYLPFPGKGTTGFLWFTGGKQAKAVCHSR